MSADQREWHMAPEDEEIESRIRLKRFREMAGKAPKDLAQFIGNSVSSYYDLEEHNGELYRGVSIGKLSAICSALGIKARDLFDERTNVEETISPEQLISKVQTYLKETGISIAEFEDRIGFEIDRSLKDVSNVMDWNVDFLRWLCRELKLDWRLALP
jgi:transcriptional regulator with XRE-family HTH domain